MTRFFSFLIGSLFITMLARPQDFLNDLPSVDGMKEQINDRVNSLYNTCQSDIPSPHVCSVCDEFILRKRDICTITVKKMKEAKDILSWQRLEDKHRIPAVEEHYKFRDQIPFEPNPTWLKGMALSPRASMYRSSTKRPLGFSSCSYCKDHVEKKKIPLYAIVNMNFVGCAPKELTDLNDVEKAFLTPTHSYGYCFNYQGGRMMQMKGQMTFMHVEPRSLAKAVSTLELMGLDKHVMVLLSGKMTYGQKQKIEQLTTVRTDKMIAAVKWLSENHREWKNVDLEKLKTQIANTKPIRMDKSTTCESGNATVEEDIVFTCYFPDGKANASSGGFDNPLDFKEFVDIMQENNYDVHFKAELEREFVKGKEGDQLISACPLQFPYGVGGMDETSKGTCRCWKVDVKS